MPSIRYALPVLAAAGSAYAACSTSATATIQNGGDASAIATCTTFSGSIAVATGMSADISFGSLQELDGSLIIENNSNLQRVGGDNLQTISGELRLNDDSQLASLSFPKLTEVDTLTLTGLANLRSLSFGAEVSKCNKLDIENTQLQNLQGINLKQASSIIIANNPAVANITMQLTNITGSIDLSFNNADVMVAFPNLQAAQNISMRSVGNLSLPALSQVSPGSFGIFSSKMESFYAPNLTTIAESLTIVDNNDLKDLSFASLETVGASFLIENNTALQVVDQLPKLTTVGAALDISGNLTKVTSPSLNYVKGVFNLQSTADLGDSCDFYDNLESKGKVPKNKYVCKGELAKAGTAGTSTSGGSSSNKTGAATTLSIQNTVAGFAALAVVLYV